MTETLQEEIMTVDFRETEFDYEKESPQYSYFDFCGPPEIIFEKPNALFSNQIFIQDYKKFD